MTLQNVRYKKKNKCFQEKTEMNVTNSKELWKILKSLGMKSNRRLLYKDLPGVCAGVSTDSCLVQLTDFVFKGLNKGIHTGIVDTQKTFNYIDMMNFNTNYIKFAISPIAILRKNQYFKFKNTLQP